MNKIFEKSRGQIVVLYAGIIASLLVAAALGTDEAVKYMNWQHARKVADAAALAGANYLTGIAYPSSSIDSTCTGQTDNASQVACTYAVKNGLPAGDLSITDTATTITVTATQSGLPYYFGNAMGTFADYSVSATAVAGSPGPVNTVEQGLLPLGLQCTSPCPAGSLVAGEPVSFGTKFISSTINLAGNWGWLDLDGSGGSTLKTNIADGASGSYSVGQTIYTDPGKKNGPITQGLNSRFAGCPTIADPCNGSNPNGTSGIPGGDPCLVVVPVVDFGAATKNGNTSLTIEAFAEVYLDPNTTTGTSINGCYVSSVVGDTQTGSTYSDGPTTPPVLVQ
jgi:hypothetical protein